jgi:hypothetical protein
VKNGRAGLWGTQEPMLIFSFLPRIFAIFVVVSDQGPEPRLRFALQPLGLLYTLFSRSSHCRRQMSLRPTRRVRSKQREVEL